MKILYLHGWQSVPGGIKPSYLASHGHEVIQPALPEEDFGAALVIAQTALEQHRPEAVVGSSRGGAVAMGLAADTTPLILLCPAWKRWGNATTVKAGTLILHAVSDEVIPYTDSLELLRNSHLPENSLISVGSDHRLSDAEPLRAMLAALERIRAENAS